MYRNYKLLFIYEYFILGKNACWSELLLTSEVSMFNLSIVCLGEHWACFSFFRMKESVSLFSYIKETWRNPSVLKRMILNENRRVKHHQILTNNKDKYSFWLCVINSLINVDELLGSKYAIAWCISPWIIRKGKKNPGKHR